MNSSDFGTAFDEPLPLAVNRRWCGKPSKAAHARFDKAWECAELRPSDLMRMVTVQGYSFTCLLKTNGARNRGNFAGLRLLGLDFDQCGTNEVTAHPLAAYASFAYESSSSTLNKPRCRLVFATAAALDYQAASVAIAALQHAFRDLLPDTTTKDPTRCWYGAQGKQARFIGGLLDNATLVLLIADLPTPQPRAVTRQTPVSADDAAIIARVQMDAGLARLWDGDWSAHPSQSEGDFRLIGALGVLTGWDIFHTLDLFRRSRLAEREKAARPDYLPTTFHAARRADFRLADCTTPANTDEDILARLESAAGLVLSSDFSAMLNCRADALASARGVALVILHAMQRAGASEGVAISLARFERVLNVASSTVRAALMRLERAGVIAVERVVTFDERTGEQQPTRGFSLGNALNRTPIHTGAITEGDAFLAIAPLDAFARGKSKSSRTDARPPLGKAAAFIVARLATEPATAHDLAVLLGASGRGVRRILARLVALGLLVFDGDLYRLTDDWRTELDEIAPSLKTFRIGDERELARVRKSLRYFRRLEKRADETSRTRLAHRIAALEGREARLLARLGWDTPQPQPASQKAHAALPDFLPARDSTRLPALDRRYFETMRRECRKAARAGERLPQSESSAFWWLWARLTPRGEWNGGYWLFKPRPPKVRTLPTPLTLPPAPHFPAGYGAQRRRSSCGERS